MVVIQVFIMRNGAFEGTEMVTGDRIEIGRDASCQLSLDDEGCSRRHAVVFEHDGKLAVQDLDSANGTRVNGEPVLQPRYLGPRDDVAIGPYTLKFKVMSGMAPRPTQPPVPSGEPTRVLEVPRIVRAAAAAPPPPALGIDLADDDGETTELSPPPEGARGYQPQTAPPSRPYEPPPLTDPPAPPRAPWAPLAPSPPAPAPVKQAAPQPQPVQQPLPSRAAPRPEVTVAEARQPVAPSTAQRSPPRPPPVPDHTQPEMPLPSVTAPRESEPPPALLAEASDPSLEIPDGAGLDLPQLTFAPTFLDDDDHDEDELEDPDWSLVQNLVRPPSEKAGADPVIEVVHYRGDVLVDHRMLVAGDVFAFGDRMSRRERKERGIAKVIPIVRHKKGVAEIFTRPEVQGRLLRGGQPVDLAAIPAVKGQGAAPLSDGELASLRVGDDRFFVKFAGVPQLLWTPEQQQADRESKKLTAISLGSSLGVFVLFLTIGWILQFRAGREEVIQIQDDGFAEVVERDLEFEEPKPPETPPEPIPTPEPEPQKQAEPTKVASVQQPDKAAPTPDAAPPKPGVMDILNNIPKVNDSASNQNLNAALSNIKGVRVPGGAAGFKTSALVGKTPTSGVQIGGTGGGVATSGLNSVIRNNGAAGAMGGKGDRAVAGTVNVQHRLSKVSGQGQLSKEDVLRIINKNIGQIQTCYERALRSKPGLAGRVVLEWVVSPTGKVTSVKQQTATLDSSDAVRCMMDKVKGWKFPEPKGGPVTIVFPFVFNQV